MCGYYVPSSGHGGWCDFRIGGEVGREEVGGSFDRDKGRKETFSEGVEFDNREGPRERKLFLLLEL